MTAELKYASSHNPSMHTGGRLRSIAFERQVTEEAARGVMDPTRIIQHAETRASRLSGEYVTDASLVADRDRRRETIEELVDARNHLCWWIEERQAADDEDRAHDGLIALRLVLMAYDRLLDD